MTKKICLNCQGLGYKLGFVGLNRRKWLKCSRCKAWETEESK